MLLGIFLIVLGWFHYQPQLPPAPQAPLSQTVTRIEVDKSDRRMVVFAGEEPLKTYTIALGFAPEGTKTREGDGKTPEGVFAINRRNPQSKYHLSLGLDYPHPAHTAAARAAGHSPGGDIFIHGQPNALGEGMMLAGDWTAGCIAVTNAEMRELWEHVPLGTPVVIRP